LFCLLQLPFQFLLERTANRYKGYSEHYADRSKYYQQRSDEIQQQADEALETANNYKQQASEQTTQLNKIMQITLPFQPLVVVPLPQVSSS
jgi:hypothetical protein